MKKFTLLELLIVIAIIGILASILMPSLGKARLKAQQAVCLSNQHQIAIATISYTVENNAFAPHNEGDEDDDGTSDNWPHKLLNGYLPPTEGARFGPVFKCPNSSHQHSYSKLSIAMNNQLTGGTNNVGSTPNILGATASETVMLMDSYKWWIQIEHSQMTNAKLIEDENIYNIARHLLKANVTFLDGHGKAQSVSYLLSKNDNSDTFWDPEK